jgi:hypothetical protein
MEPNNARGAAKAATGTVQGLKICASDDDWYSIATAGTVRVEFTHAAGDLDVEAFDAAGTRIGQSAGTTNVEQVSVPAGGFVRVFGYSGATNTYRLIAP